MDIRQLEYFVRIAELGSFTRASIDLDVAQPALSRQIRALEVELQQSLLLRNGRGVEVTEAGALLLERSRAILHQIQLTKEDVGRVGGRLAGNVSVGLPPSIAKMLAVPLTHAFKRALPDATLSIAEGLSLPLQDQLIHGHLDIALLYNPVWSPELDCTSLLDEDFYLITLREGGASEEPISLRELASIPLIIPKRAHAIRTLVESRMASIGCRPTIALEVDGVSAILDLVADGAGAGILSVNAVSTSARESTFICRQVVEPRLRSALALATSARRPITRIQKETVEMLRDMAARLLPRAIEPPANGTPTSAASSSSPSPQS